MIQEIFKVGARYDLIEGRDEEVCQIPSHFTDFYPVVFVGTEQLDKNYHLFAYRYLNSKIIILYGLSDFITTGERVMARNGSQIVTRTYMQEQKFGTGDLSASDSRKRFEELSTLLEGSGL
ncbi:hypothetical protein FJZ18_03220 [Candidatus Pacearchaeota archaeon]|nr:hypothetical protein [Candidatus Pacearchaeota archaeon]